MKRMMVVMLVVLVAASATAGGAEIVAWFGQWAAIETEGSLLDEPMRFVALFAEAGGILVSFRMDPEPRMIVNFPEYLGLENRRHDQAVLFVTDKREAEALAEKAFRGVGDALMWDGMFAWYIMYGMMDATQAMFRTWDFRDSRVDRALRLVPDDTMKAIAWLTK